ncbi:hypothetical protein I7T76_000549 [Salmonella enterica]|nr:hypothetical protein [Salmonella enterica]
MQKFLSLLFSRRALAVVGVLVLALLVWFVGPLVSFDTLRPLASVGSRVVTIALLLMLLVLWLVNWSMSIIGISVLCLAIGFVTPLLALGDVHPFAPLWVRLTLIGFILLMYALYGLYRLWRALRMDEQLLRRFLHPRGEEGSSGLAYDLQVLRTLASPDSPLMRLGKAVVEQTTLVPPPDPQARQKQLAQRASGNAGKVVQTAKLFQDIHPEERLEKTLVDDRFAALREVIAGRTDGGQSGGGTMQIASLLTMLNEYYTQLTIADSALAAGTLPARITAADKLQLEAAKLPAPLKNILLDLTKQGTRKINAGTGDVLNTQMEAMMGDDCRDAIDGRYPFADSPQEVSAEDFNRIFASGGVLDAFWSKQLAPLADTASDPWRYKPTEGNMTLQGPDLTPFQQAKQIRSVFFNSEGGKKFSWSMQISVVDMDPAITELVIDIDGQVLRYAHGPDRPLKVTWPGPRNGSMAEITASPRIRQDTSTLLTGGPWALFHLLDAGMVQETAVRGRQLVEYDFDGRRVVLEITAGRDFNPVSRELLQNFSCPARAL